MKFFISWMRFFRKVPILLPLSMLLISLLQVNYLHATSSIPNESNANVLLNDYYSLRLKDPESARMILMQAVQKFPEHELLQSEFGYLLLREGNYQDALIHFKIAHQIDPEHSDYTLQIGYILNSLQQNDEALKYFRDVAATDKGINGVKARDIIQRSAQNKTVIASQQRQKDSEAISTSAKTAANNHLSSSVTVEQEKIRPYSVLLKADPTQAKIFLNNFLLVYPNNTIAIREKGIQKLQEKDYKEAITLFKKSWLIKQDDQILMLLSEAWLRSGNLLEAEHWLSQGLNSSDNTIKNKAQSLLDTITKGVVSINLPENLTLIDVYYILKKKRPNVAKKILAEIIKMQPENANWQMEIGYSFLKEHQPEKALPYILKAHQIERHNEDITLQGAYVYSALKENKKAEEWFHLVLQSSEPSIAAKAQEGLRMLKKGQETRAYSSEKKASLSPYDRLMNQYYVLQKKHPEHARKILQQVINQYPNNIRALREMGYLLIREKNNEQAISYLISAWDLQPQSYDLALQIGYLYDGLGKKRKAFAWFKKAFPSKDADIRENSYKAMVNLGSQRFQLFEQPLFADIWSAPFAYSRFSLLVIPEHLRIGRSFGRRNQIEIYYNNYYNKDNRSKAGGGGELPSIFDDDYVLNGAGIRYYTKTKIPLVFYFEIGRAYDLLYRDRDRWRGDGRGGVLAWYAWGLLPGYTERLMFPFSKTDDFYGDSSWFSRYKNDWISYGRYRKGYRVLQYRNVSVTAYARAFIIADSKKYFYNNLFEYGPGIAIFPNNTWPIAIRLERRFGHYIKVNGPDINPYGPRYLSDVAMFEMYYRF